MGEVEPFDPLSVDDILSWEPRYRQGEVVRFVCGNVGATLAGHRFQVRDVILVKLCTDWDGENFDSDNDLTPWGLYLGGDYGWRTLYRIAQTIELESGEGIWDRLGGGRP